MRLPAEVCRSALIVLLLSALAHPVAAQIPGVGSSKIIAPPQQAQIEDPLGRTTPRQAITAFIRAVDRDDLVSAARYMQVTESQRRNTETLARDLKALMDRYFSQTLSSISDAPEGALDDGLPIDRERVGPLAIGNTKIDIVLVRVTDPQFGPIWLISPETLAQVPELRDSIAPTWAERVMPRSLVSRDLFGISLAQWLVLAGALVMPLVALTLLAGTFIFLGRSIFKDAVRGRQWEVLYEGLQWPLIIALTLTIHLMSIPLLGLPLAFRIAYARVALVVAVIAFVWLLRRLLTLGFARARHVVWAKDRSSTRSLMLLGERLLKALVMVVAVMAVLIIAGMDTKTALAGIGILGVALALGAQKTVENILGGVLLLSDRALAVGDTCNISNRVGVVEDITLRSVRLRTSEQSLVSIPAGVLAQAGIENFASRAKIPVQTTLRLRYGTSVDQLRQILHGIRKLLDQDPRLEKESTRIRLTNFGDRAIELDLFAYVRTSDLSEFMAVREALLLEIATVVQGAGSVFAQPTEFIYVNEAPEAYAAVRAAGSSDSASERNKRGTLRAT